MAEKIYQFRITAEVVDQNGDRMFDAHVTYENMDYGNVVVVEKAIVGMLEHLSQFGEEKAKTKGKN